MANRTLGQHARLQRMASRLKTKRIEMGLSQADLARLSGVGVITISNIERAVTAPSPLTRQKLLKALNCTNDELWGLGDASTPGLNLFNPIVAQRQKYNLSQKKLGEFIGLSASTIRELENGGLFSGPEALEKAALFLKMTPDQLKTELKGAHTKNIEQFRAQNNG